MIKNLILDLDGTLLDSDKKIKQDEIRAISEMLRNNINIIIASGRHYCEITKYINELNIPADSPVISCDGQYIFNATGKCLYTNDFLSSDDLKNIAEIIGDNNSSIRFFTSNYDYYLVNGLINKLVYFFKLLVRHNKKNRLFSLSSEIYNIEKVVVRGNISSTKMEHLSNLYSIHKFDGYSEIKKKNVNKYTGLIAASKIFGFSLCDSCFIGDDFNDIECFDEMDFTVAMNNAPDIIKEKSKYITDSNDNNGVSKAINSLIIQKEM